MAAKVMSLFFQMGWKFIMDKREKKIILQQKIIDALSSKNKNMEKQIGTLKNDLEFQKNIPQEGYDEAKRLIEKLNEYIKIYEEELSILKESIEKYNFARNGFYEMKDKYKNEMDKLRKSIKLGIK